MEAKRILGRDDVGLKDSRQGRIQEGLLRFPSHLFSFRLLPGVKKRELLNCFLVPLELSDSNTTELSQPADVS